MENPDNLEGRRALSRDGRYEATKPEPTTEAPGYVIWKAWRDGMLAQGREVAPERMSWDTVPDRDKVLDAAIEAQARAQADAELLALREIAERGVEARTYRFEDITAYSSEQAKADAKALSDTAQAAKDATDRIEAPLRARIAELREALLKLGGQCVLADRNFDSVLAHANAVYAATDDSVALALPVAQRDTLEQPRAETVKQLAAAMVAGGYSVVIPEGAPYTADLEETLLALLRATPDSEGR